LKNEPIDDYYTRVAGDLQNVIASE